MRDVLGYRDRVRVSGLNLLAAPGNDGVAVTALGAAGCHIVLFTTGRGTPLGGVIPTMKIASSSNARRCSYKSDQIALHTTPCGDVAALLALIDRARAKQTAAGIGAGAIVVCYWRLEKGRTDNPSMSLLRNLADHFGLSVAALVGEDPAASENARIGRMFRQAGDLAPEDLDILNDMMQSLLRRCKKASSGSDQATC